MRRQCPSVAAATDDFSKKHREDQLILRGGGFSPQSKNPVAVNCDCFLISFPEIHREGGLAAEVYLTLLQRRSQEVSLITDVYLMLFMRWAIFAAGRSSLRRGACMQAKLNYKNLELLTPGNHNNPSTNYPQ